jgi:TrmH family RNA methyltransferase
MNERRLTSLQNPLVKHLVNLRDDAKYRYAHGSVVIEGVKPVGEVARHIKKLFVLESVSDFFLEGAERWIVSEPVMKKISGMNATEGVLAEVAMPAFSSLKQAQFILALDRISDPGNLGTLLRTALALGWDGVYMLRGCCDPFNDKALRSARGAHFRIPIAEGSVDGLRKLAMEGNLDTFVADLSGRQPREVPSLGGKILVLGNEAQGASKEIHLFCSRVTIPMPGEMESLNVAVAGGILMYELKNK